MTSRGTEDSDPTMLARLLMAGIDPAETWLPGDYPGVLRAMLQSSMRALGIRTTRSEPGNLRLLFAMHEPPPEIVRGIKDHAKTLMATADPSLPRPVAGVIYYACASLARRKRLEGVTAIDDAALRQGLQWCAGQQWLTSELRKQLGLDQHVSD